MTELETHPTLELLKVRLDVTHVEAWFGIRIRDSKWSDKGVRGHADPTNVDAINSFSSGKGKGSSSPRDDPANARKSTGKQSCGNGPFLERWLER